jgi:hypothetical protein
VVAEKGVPKLKELPNSILVIVQIIYTNKNRGFTGLNITQKTLLTD